MTDQIGGMRQAGAMMARDTVKKDRLAGRVGEQVSGKRHLFGRCTRASHGDHHPADSGFPDHFDLVAELGIGGVDCRQRHNCLDRLATDDSSEWAGPLPGPAHELPRENHLHPLFEPDVAVHDRRGR